MVDPSPRMLRRTLLTTGLCIVATPTLAADSFDEFLDGVEADAVASGIDRQAVEIALRLPGPNKKVIELDRHQPEFTLTWAEYRERVLPDARMRRAAEAFNTHAAVFGEVERRYRVDPSVIVGIWGLESSFGDKQGSFNVCDALATLAFDGRRRAFFRGELLNALRVVERRAIAPADMLGSYAGAMGQPQFMPSAYLRFAVAYDGGSRADIWQNEPDVFASIANYLARSGWRLGEPWGQPVLLTDGIDPSMIGRENRRSLADWQKIGVRRSDGRVFSRGDVDGALLLPDGERGDAFIVYRNFEVIRRYNPSDFYALGVGLLGDQIA